MTEVATVPSPRRSPVRGGFAGLDPCVHCGFCLQACPTYELTADESDSPRGRIVLMRALERGELAPDDAGMAMHLDRCLGCRGCESACPSGVAYGAALQAARAAIGRVRPIPAVLRALLWMLERPGRQGAAWALSRALRDTGLPRVLARGAGPEAPRWVGLLAMLAATAANRRTDGGMETSPGTGPRTGARAERLAVLTGCVMNGLFAHVHRATRLALEVNGCEVVEVSGQVCCGALAAHAGDERQAREMARENVRAFDAAAPGATIVVNSAGCGAIMKDYGDMLRGDGLEERARALASRVRDIAEVLASRGPRPGRPLSLRVAYDAPCHLLHAQRVEEAPLRLLSAIPGLDLAPLEGGSQCCGSAGLYSLAQPALAQQVLALKLDAVAAARPDVVATGNPGCLMHMGAGALLRGLDVEVRHPVELLAWSYTA